MSVKAEMERIAHMIDFLKAMPNPTEKTPELIAFYDAKLGELMKKTDEFKRYLNASGKWVVNRLGDTEDDL
ncbi:hypothetical protein [Agrobacterium pusense]|jgi:hypothetical protein|uniref:hypothetical protein n=1 Tax=Agrobacterium pusense TaxID=648995 RepID=UPI0037BE90E9